MAAIANYAQACDRLLSRPAPNLDDIRTAMREIAGQAVRAGDILRRLRSLAQSQPMRRERADLNAAIKAIRDLILADGAHPRPMGVDLDLCTLHKDGTELHLFDPARREGDRPAAHREQADPGRRTAVDHRRVAVDRAVSGAWCRKGREGLTDQGRAILIDKLRRLFAESRAKICTSAYFRRHHSGS